MTKVKTWIKERNMKKILLGLAVLLLVITGCSVKDPVTYKEPAEIIARFDNNETFAFVIGDATCPACQSYLAGTVKEFQSKDGVTLEYIDLDKLDESSMELAGELVKKEKYLDGEFSVTPTTYFVVEGKVVEVSEGAVNYETLSSNYELVD